ncbi:hypothetical protein DsansV1_C19g0156731 [Dioscorea sansibarensis]
MASPSSSSSMASSSSASSSISRERRGGGSRRAYEELSGQRSKVYEPKDVGSVGIAPCWTRGIEGGEVGPGGRSGLEETPLFFFRSVVSDLSFLLTFVLFF